MQDETGQPDERQRSGPLRRRLEPGTAIDKEKLPESIRQYMTLPPQVAVQDAPKGPNPLTLHEKIAGARFGRALSKEARDRLTTLQSVINSITRINPELRPLLPQPNPHFALRPEHYWKSFRICSEYYWKYQDVLFSKDAANQLAALLTSFLQKHPVEWAFCVWKDNAIAELMLNHREAAKRWLNWYWKRKQKIARETATYLSPTRTAASAAAFELEMLQLADDPQNQPWMRPGYGDYAAFVRWLNRNWDNLAKKKQGAPLVAAAADGFRRGQPKTPLSSRDLVEICSAYKKIEPLCRDRVDPYRVVLTVVAKRHQVSARVVTTVLAEMNRHRRSQKAPKKARR